MLPTVSAVGEEVAQLLTSMRDAVASARASTAQCTAICCLVGALIRLITDTHSAWLISRAGCMAASSHFI